MSEELEGVSEEAADDNRVAVTDMSENPSDSVDNESVAKAPQEGEHKPEHQEEIDLKAEEAAIISRAKEMGWDADKFPDGHPRKKSPHEYVQFGEQKIAIEKAHAELAELKAATNEQFESYKNLMDIRTERKIQELQAKKTQAEADYDLDAYKNAESEINQLNADTAPKAINDPADSSLVQELAAWDKKNPWISEEGDKRETALNALRQFQETNPNLRGSPDEGKMAVAYVDGVMAGYKEKSKENPRVANGHIDEGKAPSHSSSGKITFGSLTGGEKQDWEQGVQMGYFQNNEKGRIRFLDSVKTVRQQEG